MDFAGITAARRLLSDLIRRVLIGGTLIRRMSIGRILIERTLVKRILIERVKTSRVPRGPVPGPFSVQNIGAPANWIQCATSEVDKKTVPRRRFHPAGNLLVEQILSQNPREPAHWSRDQVHLANSGHTGFSRARPRSILVPRRSRLRAVLLDRQLTQRPDVPLGAVRCIPHESLEAAPPIGFRV